MYDTLHAADVDVCSWPQAVVTAALNVVLHGRTHPWRQALQLHAPRHKGGQQLAGPQEAAGPNAVQQQVQLT